VQVHAVERKIRDTGDADARKRGQVEVMSHVIQVCPAQRVQCNSGNGSAVRVRRHDVDVRQRELNITWRPTHVRQVRARSDAVGGCSVRRVGGDAVFRSGVATSPRVRVSACACLRAYVRRVRVRDARRGSERVQKSV